MDAKYKRVTVYDAEKRRNIGYSFKTSNFNTEEELIAHCDKIKADQREKNRIFKESKYTKEVTDINALADTQLNNIDNFRLDPNTGNSCVILGSSKRGKTTLMMYLYDKLYASDKDLITTLFSGNHHINAYKDRQNLLLADGFNELSERYVNKEKYINSKTNNKYKWLNLFDDIIDMKYSKLVNKLVLTYRNANISTIMCLQYAYLLSKSNRANVNNIIIFGCNSEEGKRDLIDLYLKHFFVNMGLKSSAQQITYFDKITDKYGFFYIDNVRSVMTTHRIIIN